MEKEVVKSMKVCTSGDFQPSCTTLNWRKSRCIHFLTEKLEAWQMIDTQAHTLRAFTQVLLGEYGKVIYTIKREFKKKKRLKNYFQFWEIPSNTTCKKYTGKAKRESITKSDFKLICKFGGNQERHFKTMPLSVQIKSINKKMCKIQ